MKPARKSSPPSLSASPFETSLEVATDAMLGDMDRKYLETREKIIAAGRRTFLEVGRALMEIRDYKKGLLCERYGGWEQYCTERWEFGRSYAYRLIGAAEVLAEMSPRGDNGRFGVPSSEKQIRALRLLARPADMCRAWREANEEAGEREVTSGLVSHAVRKMIKAGAKTRTVQRAPKTTKPKRVQLEIKHVRAIRVQLTAIRKAATGTKAAGKIEAAIAEIEELLSK